jgi:hypothetical protein
MVSRNKLLGSCFIQWQREREVVLDSGIVIVEGINPTVLSILSVDDVGRLQNYVASTKTVSPKFIFFFIS